MDLNHQQIQITAERDAGSDTNKLIWFVVGLALSIIGLLAAYIYQQDPPASRFFEKSEEYSLFYTDAYKAKLRSVQVKYALFGFLITAVLFIIYIVFIFSIYSRMFRLIGNDFF
ncbi:hypothetical protein F4212_11805 [Candidatus Poribacteria bacterium]|nr:hypothetical protein [Candidatus Poribacteria bacterium]